VAPVNLGRFVCAAVLVGVVAPLSAGRALAQAPGPIPTPTPRMVDLPAAHPTGGAPLMEVLAQPTAALDLGGGRVSMQHLANLLWAGYGPARAPEPAEPGAPNPASARPIEVYVLLRAGAFLHDPAGQHLKQVVEQDIRGLSGPQDPAWRAPVTLVYVVSVDPASRLTGAERDLSAAVGVGMMVQNVALYCASEGLAAIDRPLTNRRALARRLRLRTDQRVIAAQAIGQRRN
jgi:hypothetical protein